LPAHAEQGFKSFGLLAPVPWHTGHADCLGNFALTTVPLYISPIDTGIVSLKAGDFL